MAATRKLQAEIDRCMKKVAEGVEKFQDTWQKVHHASNTNQKEKYEEDLKKEIKKLQRLRDQIKTWIASPDIKDKSVLMEKRKLIEMQMERFKVVERETKTKAYSKEGLTSGQKLDPVEKERSELSQWLNQCIDSLNLQCDQFEAEIETLSAAKKKKNRNENAEKIEEYQMVHEKHRDHVQKLETLLRMVSNDTVDFSQIKDIKDDVEYYIENCQDDDFTENEMIYEDIDGLEEMLLDLSNVGNNENNTNSVEASETMSTNSASSPIPYSFNHSSSIDLMNENDTKRRHRSSTDDNKMGGSQVITSAKVPPLSSTASAAVAQSAAGIGTAVSSVTTPTFSSSNMQQNPPASNLLATQGQGVASKPSVLTNLTSSQQQNASSISSLITATGPGSGPGLTPATNGNNSTTVNNNLNALNNAPSSGIHPGLSNSYKNSSSLASITAVATSSASSTGSGGASGTPGLPGSGNSSNASGVLKSLSSSGFTHLQSSSNSSTTINSHPNNSSPSSGSTLTSLTNHVISSGTSTSLSSSITGLASSSVSSLGGAQPNFAAAVQQQQLNGHANSLSEVRTSPPPTPVSSASSVTSIAAGSTLGAVVSSSANTNSQSFSMPSSVAVSNMVGSSLPLTTSSTTDPSLLPSLKSIAQEATNRAGLSSFSDPLSSLAPQNEPNSSSLVTPQANSSNLSAQSSVGTNPNISQTSLFQQPPTTGQVGKERSQKKSEAHIPPLLGVAPLGPVPLNKDTQLQYAMLEAAFTHMPHPSDSEKLRPYLPRNPCATPVYYPQLPPVSSDSLEFFQKLSTETLFFIFYYMEGTKAQYLAAKALKKHSWRFHTKYMMWFQRYEEPKVINDEFEQGAYIYFDFEKWGQRKKEGFTFEYRFLEDRDLS